MNQSDVRYNVEESASYLKGVSIGAFLFGVFAAICFGISIALGADMTTGGKTSIGAAESIGFLFQMAAMFFGFIAALCAMMAAGTLVFLALCSAALPFAHRDSYDEQKCSRQQGAEERRERQVRVDQLDPYGKWW